MSSSTSSCHYVYVQLFLCALLTVVHCLSLQRIWRKALEQRRFDARRATLTETRKRVIKHIAATVESSSTRLVEEILNGNDDNVAPCLNRLANRVRNSLAESVVSKDIPALFQDDRVGTLVPHPRKPNQRESLPKSASSLNDNATLNQTAEMMQAEFESETDRTVPEWD